MKDDDIKKTIPNTLGTPPTVGMSLVGADMDEEDREADSEMRASFCMLLITPKNCFHLSKGHMTCKI